MKTLTRAGSRSASVGDQPVRPRDVRANARPAGVQPLADAWLACEWVGFEHFRHAV
jgi:hypothetical protein